MKNALKVLSWIVVVALVLVILSSLMSCEKQAIYTESCANIAQVVEHSEEFTPGKYVVYFSYDVLVRNTAQAYVGGPDSLRNALTSIAISGKAYDSLEELESVMNNIVCEDMLEEQYYNTYPETFETYISGSKRFKVFAANYKGEKKGDVVEFITEFGRTVTGIKPVMIYSLQY